MDSIIPIMLLNLGLLAVVANNINNINITEAAGRGTVLWNVTNPNQNCSVKNAVPSTDWFLSVELSWFFRLDPQLGALVLTKPLDLEVIGDLFSEHDEGHYVTADLPPPWGQEFVSSRGRMVFHVWEILPTSLQKSKDALIKVQLICENETTATQENTTITVHVLPENEFRPQFQHAPYSVEIPEGIRKGKSIFSLQDKVRDRDVMAYNQIVSFDVHPYLISALDGRRYFFVNNKTGEVTTTSEIDYETFGRHNYVLNITATDDGGLVSYPTTLAVNITDVDDMPPEFRQSNPSCFTNCTVHAYSHVIDIHHQGVLDHITPYKVFARDGDLGIGARINYSIEYDTDDELATNIIIDDVTGVLQVRVPFDNFTNVTSGSMADPFSVTVTLIATEVSNKRRSSNASFTLAVYRVWPTPVPSRPRLTTRNITTGETTDTDDNGPSTALLLEILVPLCTAIVFIAAAIIVLVKRNIRDDKRHREPGLHCNNIDIGLSDSGSEYDEIGIAHSNSGSHHNDIDVSRSDSGSDYDEIGMAQRDPSSHHNDIDSALSDSGTHHNHINMARSDSDLHHDEIDMAYIERNSHYDVIDTTYSEPDTHYYEINTIR